MGPRTERIKLFIMSVDITYSIQMKRKGYHFYSAEIDFRRQILTSKVDPSTVRLKIFIMDMDPYHRYSNEAERAD